MVFGAAVIATHPTQEDKQHQALSSGIVTLGGPSVPWRVVSLCREMRCNFPVSVNEVVMRRWRGIDSKVGNKRE